MQISCCLVEVIVIIVTEVVVLLVLITIQSNNYLWHTREITRCFVCDIYNLIILGDVDNIVAIFNTFLKIPLNIS